MKLKVGDWVEWTPGLTSDRVAQVTDIFVSGNIYIQFPGDHQTYPVLRREIKKVSRQRGVIAIAKAALGV